MGSNVPVKYEPSRMYGARTAFARGEGFLFDKAPRPLSLDVIAPLELSPAPGSIGPPQGLRKIQEDLARRAGERPDVPGAVPTRTFNPSIAPAPAGLCDRCTWAISLRVDTLHQCDSTNSPYEAAHSAQLSSTNWFRGTALAIYDSAFVLLGWTWLVNSPTYQIASAGTNASDVRSSGCIPVGSSDAFAPAWTKQTFDARLLNIGGELLVTYACSSCVFSLSPIRITADAARASGQLRGLRAWATDRKTYQFSPWLAGRNQALFVHVPPSSQHGVPLAPALWVQSRLGVVGLLGRPTHSQRHEIRCESSAGRRSVVPPKPDNCMGEGYLMECGTSPRGTLVAHRRLEGLSTLSARQVTNRSRSLRKALRVAGAFGGLSLTSNLLRVSWASRGSAAARGTQAAPCTAYLGVGHLHRGEGHLNRRMYRRRPKTLPPWEHGGSGIGGVGSASGKRRRMGARAARGEGMRDDGSEHPTLRRHQPFAFGFRYTHFFYTLAPDPPFKTIGVSAEFCVAAAQDQSDCESVQFLSGLALHRANHSTAEGGDELLITYGVNDCEARWGRMRLDAVLKMLRPVPDDVGITGGVCR